MAAAGWRFRVRIEIYWRHSTGLELILTQRNRRCGQYAALDRD